MPQICPTPFSAFFTLARFSSSHRRKRSFLCLTKQIMPEDQKASDFFCSFFDVFFTAAVFLFSSSCLTSHAPRLCRFFQISIPYYFSGVLSTFYRSKFRKAAVPFDGQMRLRAYYSSSERTKRPISHSSSHEKNLKLKKNNHA